MPRITETTISEKLVELIRRLIEEKTLNAEAAENDFRESVDQIAYGVVSDLMQLAENEGE